MNPHIFREYDIRGIVGKELDSGVAFCIGRAFGIMLRRRNPAAARVSVGRDVRNSSVGLASNLIGGIISTGLDVIDIDVCPTPVQYFSLFHLDLDGGIMVTGSHNPSEYNGFKISIGKDTIHGRDIQELKDIIFSDAIADVPLKGRVENFDAVAAYKRYMFEQFSYLAGDDFKRLKIVVDAGNGTAGTVVPEILGAAGCEVTGLYCEPDGNFPNHHPDPTVVEYIRDLIEETKKTGADIGVGYDGDSDRIGVVDREGNVIWGDQLMIILGRALLKEKPGATIIGDVKCSQFMFEDIKAHGGNPIMWKTGHSLVKQKMRDEKALLAGEFSGHIFIADRYFGYDDAVYTTLRLVEIMKKTGKDIKELLADVPKACFTPEIRIECSDSLKKRVVEKITDDFRKLMDNETGTLKIKGLDTTDGVRVVFEKGWGLVRTSNTQPVIVMRVEAVDELSLDNYRTLLERELASAMEAA
ncbi:MAG: phosphomannomutase/phosphoglucomutase [Nitrospirae bacterium]|nr:MAG: phosphomannomutase/phosphoglucomutase [Nitrospirota bacterium]